MFRHQRQRVRHLRFADFPLRKIPRQKICIALEYSKGSTQVMSKCGVQFLLPLHQHPHLFLPPHQLPPHILHRITQASQLILAVVMHMEVKIISPNLLYTILQNPKRRRQPFLIENEDRHDHSCKCVEIWTPHPHKIQKQQLSAVRPCLKRIISSP